MSYDVFISYKNLDEQGNQTPDFTIAQELYYALSDSGYKVFFSAVSLGEIGSSRFKADIDDALDTSKIMIVVLTNADYALSKWVKYEWDGFYSDYLDGIRKEPNLFTLTMNLNVHDLPRTLRNVQNFDYREGFLKVSEYIKNILSKKKKPQKPIIDIVQMTEIADSGNESSTQSHRKNINYDIELCGKCIINDGVVVGYERLGGDGTLVIPNGVTEIGSFAFFDCKDLKLVAIPYSVTTIGESAFRDSGLEAIRLSDGIVTKKYSHHVDPFRRCIGMDDFHLTPSTIPDSVTEIGRYAFRGCKELTQIIIPDSVTTIGEGAFYESGLTAIAIDGVTKLESCVFFGCEQLTIVYLPNSITEIGRFAFSGCKSLSNLSIPDGVSEIKIGAFEKTGLKKITIPDGVTSLGSGVFLGCKKLTNITIPNSITWFEDALFLDCKSLSLITYKGSKFEWYNIEKDDDWDEATGNYKVEFAK